MTTQVAEPNMSVESVNSADGTPISYRTTGTGPGLIIVPGALALATDFDHLATALAARFTVHTIERRGRGASGPQGDNYSSDLECADIEAVRAATGARFVFGHSFGGFLALEAALKDSAFERMAVYEPGVCIDGSIPMDWTAQCQRQLDAGEPFEAFLTFVQGINPQTSGKAPRWLLRAILPMAIKKRERLQKYALLPGTIREHAEEARRNNDFPKYAQITTPVLLMVGKEADKTGAGRAPGRLKDILPNSELAIFPKLDHFGPEKDPAAIAAAVTAFFLGRSN